jgi:hypothetical protein
VLEEGPKAMTIVISYTVSLNGMNASSIVTLVEPLNMIVIIGITNLVK